MKNFCDSRRLLDPHKDSCMYIAVSIAPRVGIAIRIASIRGEAILQFSIVSGFSNAQK